MIEFGDCRETMRKWAAAGVKVQMCVTSPPYFGLRDYGHEGQIGLEETPEQFIAELVEVFRCVRDVLTDDGTIWVNIGDSYAGSMKGSFKSDDAWDAFQSRAKENGYSPGVRARTAYSRASMTPDGCKPKDLIGIPWMLAFALRADGWYLRRDIIWNKPNAMPESAKDRPTTAHEYLFLLSKSHRYFYDNEAVKEDAVGGHSVTGSSFMRTKSKRLKAIPGHTVGTHRPDRADVAYNGQKRNRRSVWTVPSTNYKGAHAAVFPPALIEPCILAGSRPGDIVLDPFMGSGTTAVAALKHGRDFLGCELNPEYKDLQDERIARFINEGTL